MIEQLLELIQMPFDFVLLKQVAVVGVFRFNAHNELIVVVLNLVFELDRYLDVGVLEVLWRRGVFPSWHKPHTLLLVDLELDSEAVVLVYPALLYVFGPSVEKLQA